jgi:SAM-dependent methyltransferase
MDRAFDRYAEHYARGGNTAPDYALVARDPRRFRVLAPWLPEDRNTPILDIGCGWGNLLLGLWASGYHNLTGVELSKEQYDVARASLPKEIRLFHADAGEFLKSPAERFRLVIMFDVIEHMQKAVALDLLRSVFHAMEPPGSVVIRTANLANLAATYIRYIDFTHEVGYTEWSLFQLLDIAGFTDHRVIGPTTDLRWWRWYAPWRGFGLRERVVTFLQGMIYRAVGLRPLPSALGLILTVQSFRR